MCAISHRVSPIKSWGDLFRPFCAENFAHQLLSSSGRGRLDRAFGAEHFKEAVLCEALRATLVCAGEEVVDIVPVLHTRVHSGNDTHSNLWLTRCAQIKLHARMPVARRGTSVRNSRT